MAESKYRGPYLGPELDRIFLDILNRVAERWAVGTNNGVPVDEYDETFENNAKYYAEQIGDAVPQAIAAAAAAEAAAAIAQSVSSGNVLFYDYRDGKQYYLSFGASNDGYPRIALEEVTA